MNLDGHEQVVTSRKSLSGRGFLAILAAALVLRLFFCFVVYPEISEGLNWKGVDDGHDLLASNLLSGHGFTFDPSLPPNLKTPPGYAFFLAALYRLTGISLDEGWRIWVSQSLLDTASCFLVMLVSLRVFGRPRAALLGGAVYALYPQVIAYCARPFGEVLSIFLLLLAVVWALDLERAGAARTALVSGLLFGLASLVKEKILLFTPLLALVLLWRWRRELPRRLVPLFLLLAGTAAAVSPWVARGYHLTGELIPITSRSGRALHGGLVTDYSGGDEDAGGLRPGGGPDTTVAGEVFPPLADGSEDLRTVETRLEVDQAKTGAALRLIRQRPGYFARTTLLKAVAFWYWGQPRVMWVNIAVQMPLVVLALWGFILGRGRARLLVPVLLIAYFVVIHAFLVARMRYSLPVMPYVIALASYALIRVGEAARLLKSEG